MKSGRAALHANCILRKEASDDLLAFFSWRDFEKDFSAKFCPKNEATAALTKLESTRYYQGQKAVDDYIDEFSELVDEAGYTNGLSIVMKFRKGLDRDIQDRIAEMVQGRQRVGIAQHAPLMLIGQRIRPSMECSVRQHLFRQSDRSFRRQGLCFRFSLSPQCSPTEHRNILGYRHEHPMFRPQ